MVKFEHKEEPKDENDQDMPLVTFISNNFSATNCSSKFYFILKYLFY